ncbi:outer membrane lipoprotein carrier protein LolA [Streptomyces sp. SID10853]|uniref:LolA family protein n=1 Tax=Streptomyces sp. SID10853 TaxID=2706028 RepID=UPI0013C152F3|nr:outer membrane lipoprotein carrier protein LolA [Streptomyces sp. SID10853]NDZ78407.1 outer membrane lipoprotein carrier protein LolA [Streptomyces sp. SID10853]
MAPNDTAQGTGEAGTSAAARRKAARYLVPVGVAGVAAVTIGLVPALASSGDPSLPKISAQQLIEKMAASDTQQLSGTVKAESDLGIPSLGGLAGSIGGGAVSGGGDKGGSSAAPESKLMELASGTHTLRVAADGPDKQRVSIMDSAAEYSLIHNDRQVWAYDSKSNEVYHAKTGASADGRKGRTGHTGHTGHTDKLPATPKDLAEQTLKAVGPTTSVSVDGTAQVAGRDAYQLLIKPKQSGSTIGSVRIAVDSKTGTPLKFTLTPSSGGKAAIDVGFTKVDFGKPAASTFTFTPPKGAKVTEGAAPEAAPKAGTHRAPQAGPKDLKPASPEDFKGLNIIGKGWTSVARIDTGSGKGIGAPGGSAQKSGVPADAQKFLSSLGDRVTGSFGSGTVFHTRLVNALMTDDGKVFVGTVDKAGLVKAADAAK